MYHSSIIDKWQLIHDISTIWVIESFLVKEQETFELCKYIYRQYWHSLNALLPGIILQNTSKIQLKHDISTLWEIESLFVKAQ